MNIRKPVAASVRQKYCNTLNDIFGILDRKDVVLGGEMILAGLPSY